LKNDVNVRYRELPSKWISIKTLKVTGEQSMILRPDPKPYPMVIGKDPKIRIHIRTRTKMSRIRNTDEN
jgi:hypothetical protein